MFAMANVAENDGSFEALLSDSVNLDVSYAVVCGRDRASDERLSALGRRFLPACKSVGALGAIMARYPLV